MPQSSYADDPTIVDDSLLWRRIHPSWIVADENRGGFRVSSAAFDNSVDGTPTSIHLEDVARAIGKSAADLLIPYPGYAMASLTAGQGRNSGQAVGRDPLPDDQTHGFLAGPKTKSIRRQLSNACEWLITPPGAGDCS